MCATCRKAPSHIRQSEIWEAHIRLAYKNNNIFDFFNCRNRTGLTAENLKHLEKVFRDNLAKDKQEFTLAEFKKIVPSKNVSFPGGGIYSEALKIKKKKLYAGLKMVRVGVGVAVVVGEIV